MSGLLDKTHAELYEMRRKADAEQQGLLAPLEHRAFAREWSNESPVMAGVSLPFAIPGYTAGKAVAKSDPVIGTNPMFAIPYAMVRNAARDFGLHNSRSPASMEEMKQAFIGMGEGLMGTRFR